MAAEGALLDALLELPDDGDVVTGAEDVLGADELDDPPEEEVVRVGAPLEVRADCAAELSVGSGSAAMVGVGSAAWVSSAAGVSPPPDAPVTADTSPASSSAGAPIE